MAAIRKEETTPPTSSDTEARKLLGAQSKPLRNGQKTTSNGDTSVGGKSVSGGARVRGGSF